MVIITSRFKGVGMGMEIGVVNRLVVGVGMVVGVAMGVAMAISCCFSSKWSYV